MVDWGATPVGSSQERLVNLVAGGAFAGPAPEVAEPAAAEDFGSLVRATVQITAYTVRNGVRTATHTGSGTVISSDGVILTNAHVAAPAAPGLALQYLSTAPGQNPDELEVWVNVNESEPPVPRFRAVVATVDGYLDAAVMRVTATLQGAPISRADLRLDCVEIGASAAVHVGSVLTVLGYPGIGGNTISLSAGRVSGFVADRKIGQGAWMKTDATVSYGNSGGLAADADGRIVAVPTRAPEWANPMDVGGYSLLRPIDLLKPLIDAAKDGRTYESAFLVTGTGHEQFTEVGWIEPDFGERLVEDYPAGAERIGVRLGYSGMSDGEDVLVVWHDAGRQILSQEVLTWAMGSSGDGFVVEFARAGGIRSSIVALLIFVGPSLRAAGFAATTIGASAVAGRVLAQGTGEPIAGAQLVVLAPGVDPIAWSEAPDGNQLLTKAIADQQGEYRMEHRLPADASYPLLVGAEGFLPKALQLGPIVAGADVVRDVVLARASVPAPTARG